MKNKKIKIEEIIVVEGRDDITAVKRVVDGHVTALNGFSGMNGRTIEKLIEISKTNKLILLTDPDFAGKKIREKIQSKIPNIRHAFISRKDAEKNKNIGVENAEDSVIREALRNIVTVKSRGNIKESKMETEKYAFSMKDLIDNGLSSKDGSKEKREALGEILKIGYYNSKQLLNALNSFNISKEKFDDAVKEINEKY